MRIRFLFLSLLGVILFSTVYAQGEKGGIFVDPATMDFSLLEGQSGAAKVRIINEMSHKKQFRLYLNDWERDTIGRHRYVEPGTLANSCAPWVSLDKTFVELNPGETAEVTVSLKLPDSAAAAKAMRWAMLFIETIEEKKAPKKTEGIVTTVLTSYRIGVHIYQTPPTKTNRELQMQSFSVLPNTSDSVYRVACKNVGDAQLHCKSNLELMNTATGKKITLKEVEFPMFPQQVRYIDFVLPVSLEKGKYSVLATVDAGEDVPLEAAEKTIEIK